MKKPQLITLVAGVILVTAIYNFGRTTPIKKQAPASVATHTDEDGHDHSGEAASNAITIDTILNVVKKQLSIEQNTRLAMLENSITRGDVDEQRMDVYHQLSHFWKDSVGFFPPYGWYEAEAARLENSENSLTFAARLFLDNLQQEQNSSLKQWEAMQAKDLFERSLKLNAQNDSARVGLGATYLFGGISSNPMEGISMIRQVIEKDSLNLYAQLMLVQGSMISGQYDRAEARLKTVLRADPNNAEAILLMADANERMGNKEMAVEWYKKSLGQVKRPDMKAAIESRISDLSK